MKADDTRSQVKIEKARKSLMARKFLMTFKPSDYKNMPVDQYADGVDQMMKDLALLAHKDGCIAAAWALSVINEMAYRLENISEAVK